ncbi:maltooligosyl trehalose hydrolase [Prosthecobacter fusiformis]|uniref:Malto-oligosyltrehalose trehalohydrolase n=1 Tax=Prosthecobacter fusiformis TaxID=48464 RepID=A0A4R7S4R9_9BACT|nr:malto-oligosyltrehalose trehalohydrolase [Prosthecobacter fusiformis]TDU73334.1 maltooligosyl trehalose hydrolase [Prosthecobacter fusiformis]
MLPPQPASTPLPWELPSGHRERIRNLAQQTLLEGSILPVEEISNLQTWQLPFGANVSAAGVEYRVWAPAQLGLELHIETASGDARILPMLPDGKGYHHVTDGEGQAGDRYACKLADGSLQPDPASRFQPAGVHGYSQVVDPATYSWKDQTWERPAFRDLVLYELHVGTFTQEGSFLSAIAKLADLQKLGINAIEIMPLADFAGKRNWGYDGVFIYAPANAYGTPDDLRALVDAAHAHGIAVILDVVYNHVGPDGSSLAAFSPAYFDPERPTPWGMSFNFDGVGSAAVREYFASNPLYWMHEFHMDGFRLDATHAMNDTSKRHILTEIAARIHSLGGYVIAEDERNSARLIEPEDKGGYGLDAVWADDFHHSVRVGQTREQYAYLQNFSGSLEETVDTLKHGWRFRGQILAPGRVARGTEVSHVAPSSLIHCISNHDQSGNRAFGERVSASISLDSYRAISMLLCLSPYTPMFFMGQEWAASTPFLFFTDHHPGLGQLVTDGRRREFSAFPEFNDPATLNDIPDPQSVETFLRSKLDWNETLLPAHAGVLELYRQCLLLRKSQAAFRPQTRQGWDVGAMQRGVAYIRYDDWGTSYLLLFHLWPEEDLVQLDLEHLPWMQQGSPWEFLISSNDVAFGGAGCSLSGKDSTYVFGGAETLLLRSPPGF